MEIVIAAVGRPRTPGVARAIREYERRAGRLFRLRIEEVTPAGLGDEQGARARLEEGRALLGRVPTGCDLFALTRKGKVMSSRKLAEYLGELATYGLPGAAFLVGGAHGLAAEVLERSRFRLSLSPMTLTHELARLFLTEQIYRAGTLLHGIPYHKGE